MFSNIIQKISNLLLVSGEDEQQNEEQHEEQHEEQLEQEQQDVEQEQEQEQEQNDEEVIPKDSVPQTQPLPKQVANNAGGFSFQVSDLNRLRRFICLGSEKGTYYVNEAKLTLDNAKAVHRLIQSDQAMEALQEIENFSVEGRSAKQQPLIFCYAMCARFGSLEVRRKAYEALPRICRIPTHLFLFVGYCESLGESSGWGKLHRKSIQNWYNNQDAVKLAFAVTKYAQREGWSHRDVLRLCHAKPNDAAHDLVYKYVTKGFEAVETSKQLKENPNAAATSTATPVENVAIVPNANVNNENAENAEQQQPNKNKNKKAKVPAVFEFTQESSALFNKVFDLFSAVESIKKLGEDDVQTAIELITKHKLAREHLPTALLSSKPIWQSLLNEMQPTAMMRNLNKMTSVGLFENKENLSFVVKRLTNVESLKRAKVHPFNVLVSWKTYQSGRGLKGKMTWNPVPEIVKALEEAFYLSFKFVEPTGKRFVLALDVSGSMTCANVLGAEGITARDASAAMAMVTARTESNYKFMAFSGAFIPLNIKADMKMDQVLKVMNNLPFNATDCALPMTWALENKVKADVFMVFTDNETYFGKIHPHEALKQYRAKMGIAAKLIVVGMTSTSFTIADPDDSGMLDMCGFDSSAPEIVRQFVLGEI